MLPENHAGVLRTVEALVAHNRESPPERRFEGVRFDVEPYLVPGYKGARRQELLDAWVELIAGVARIARGADMRVGIDLPFWLDGYVEETGKLPAAELNGERKPVLEHLLELVDDVGLMSYRTSARGANGSVAHAMKELELAAEHDVGVYIGMETTPLPDEDHFDFDGAEPADGLPPVVAGGRWIVLEPLEGDLIRVWVTSSEGIEVIERSVAERGASTGDLLHWRADGPVRVRADALSFYRAGHERMLREADRVLMDVGDHPGFAGIAYHHYESLKELAERGQGRR